MKNILITGVGGQGSVLAAKILAQAAQAKGWSVREAETIGMAQRGGFVTSHVRMGDAGEEVYSPLLATRSADVVIAFEPAEAARALPYLAPDGLLVTASSAIQPVAATLAPEPYVPADVIAAVRDKVPDAIVVDDVSLCEAIGSRKALNIGLLATAVAASERMGRGLAGAVSVDEMREAIRVCVKPKFVDMNLKAVDIAIAD
ncbi:MAG: indolepyruvate oxidoreductase subunit beta [Coriobacteriaceae bacterium]|nr:indolepyruvate oxidoreductase subunit beta [Coriobacteriaceae bacterium]